MSFYKIYPLQVPEGNIRAVPNKINDSTITVGSCIENKTGNRKAILWKQGGSPQLLNLPGIKSEAFSINSSKKIVGELDSKPFLLDQSTGVTTLLKGLDDRPFFGRAMGINDLDQITGLIRPVPTFVSYPVIWNTKNTIPIDLFAGVNFADPFTSANGRDINNNGFVVGPAWFDSLIHNWQSFTWDNNKFNFFLGKGFTDLPNYILNAVNDLLKPQIVGHTFSWDEVSFQYQGTPILYNTLTASLQTLGIPGEIGSALDINNIADAVGFIKTEFQGIGGLPETAVLWASNGLVRVNLNHPSISDADANGWSLTKATSINNNGCIVGLGYLNGDTSKQLPWLLKPMIPINKIPIEYTFPQSLWPGEAYDGPTPRGWPLKFPFPIPGPNPFQIVGNAYTHLNNILISKNVKEVTNLMSDSKARKEIQRIAGQTINEEMKKLKIILTKHAASVKRGEKKGNISVKRKK